MIKYEVDCFGRDGEEHDRFRLVRIDEPQIVDAAGRKQWQKEAAARTKTVILDDVPITELGKLLRAVADAAAYYVRGIGE